MTMTFIQKIEVTGTPTSYALDSIPADYDDLLVVFMMRSSQSGYTYLDAVMEFNDSSANFSNRRLAGRGSTAPTSYTSPSNIVGTIPGPLATADTFASGQLYIPNYTASSAKSASIEVVQEANLGVSYISMVASLWNDTSAITKIAFKIDGGHTWAAGSNAYLYGITAGSDGTTTVS